MKDNAYRAAWVLPVQSAPIANGVVEIQNDRVSFVGSSDDYRGTTVNLGEVVLLPSWVNAHTHLEFSNCSTPFGHIGIGFTEWVKKLVWSRMNSTDPPEAAISKGIRESVESGGAALGEIATTDELLKLPPAKRPSHTTVFRELLGRDREKADSTLQSAKAWIEQYRPTERVQLGLSPHAPYSVHPELLDGIVQLAISDDLPLAMHLAETLEELELLKSQSGPLVDLLKGFGAWFPDSFVLNEQPIDYLEKLAKAPHSLIIHGNYLNSTELDFIADHHEKLHVIFCPRTHQFFGHSVYPLTEMLDRGINVAIGTDSRGSNPDLNLLSELRTIAKSYPSLPAERLIQMGTFAGAIALRIGDEYGQISVGSSAELIIAEVNENLSDPHQWIRSSNVKISRLAEFVLQG